MNTVFSSEPRLSSRFVNASFSPGWTLIVLFVALLVVAGTTLRISPPAATVTLPIKVFPPDGGSVHTEEITLDVSEASSVDSLYVKAHQPFYHRGGNEIGPNEGFDVGGAASIRINDGSWVDVRAENVNCARPERTHEKCIGGAFSTIRFSIPASDVQSGLNRIRFRYNGTDGVRSGYRVLGVGFMRPSDPSVEAFDPTTHGAHDPSALQYEDFSSWTAPSGYDSGSDVSAGKQLFESAQLIANPNGGSIRASCADCHAKDGRDLKYFNYSNKSIVARSRFHGLSAEEGNQIAAYIRSIELRKRDGSTYEAPGTPWDPPYQPGPELMATNKHPDASNQVYWAAGAGLDWVLNRDEDMLPYLFPDGNGGVDYHQTASGNRALNWRHVHMDSTLNMRELPLSIQFPDWNSWLPDVHPKDGFPSQWDGSSTRSIYQGELQTALNNYSGGFNTRELQDIEREIKGLHIVYEGELKSASNELNLSQNKFAQARLSNQQWLAVKIWESVHGNHLEDVADEMYSDDAMKPFDEPRSWIGGQRTLFDLGPHIAVPGGFNGNPPYQYGSYSMDALMTHVWYQLQVTVNPGASPSSSSQKPVDWNYHKSFLKSAPENGLRIVASHVKANQRHSNGYGVDGSGGNGYDKIKIAWGWEPFTTNPERFMLLRGDDMFSNLSESLREDLYTATLRAWNDFNNRFPISEFPRGTDNRRYNPESFVPSATGYTGSREHAQKIYQALYQTGDQFPEAKGAMDTLATWGSRMWPTTDGPAWKDLVDYSPPAEGSSPTVELTAPSTGDLVPGPDVTLSADASDPDGDIQSVEFTLGDTVIGSASSSPYEVSWTNLPFNRYHVEARVEDSQNRSGTDTRTFTVGPSDLPSLNENGVYYAYVDRGSSQSTVPDFDTLLPTRSGTVSAFDVSGTNPDDADYALRFFGYIDVPTDGTYTFYTNSADGSVLSIDDEVVVDNDGEHDAQERSGEITLSAGRHFIDVGYFVNGGSPQLTVSWSGPTHSKTAISSSDLFVRAPTVRISLNEGWNFVSSSVVPDNATFQGTFEPIASEISLVKDENGRSYLPAFGMSEIDVWSKQEAYQVYASSRCVLPIAGESVETDLTIDLEQGWNLVPYLPDTEMDPSTSLQSISDHLVTVKDEAGNIYDPSTGVNDIGTMKPGEGYLVYVDADTQLAYPASSQ